MPTFMALPQEGPVPSHGTAFDAWTKAAFPNLTNNVIVWTQIELYSLTSDARCLDED